MRVRSPKLQQWRIFSEIFLGIIVTRTGIFLGNSIYKTGTPVCLYCSGGSLDPCFFPFDFARVFSSHRSLLRTGLKARHYNSPLPFLIPVPIYYSSV